MKARPITLAEIDARLTSVYEAYQTAMDVGDLEIADAMYASLDQLLDARAHTGADH